MIGAEGKNIKRLQETYKCDIKIENGTVTINGDELIYDCTKEILAIPKDCLDREARKQKYLQFKKEKERQERIRKERERRKKEYK